MLSIRVYGQAGNIQVFFYLGKVDGEVSKKNDTIPCPKPEKLPIND